MASSRSSNPKIQQLMDDVNNIDDHDENLEQKLQKIAAAVAAEQATSRPQTANANAPIDPADAFACEGCQ